MAQATRRNADSGLQHEMSTTREGQRSSWMRSRRGENAFTARRMMSASHAPVAESPSSSFEHERRAQPSKESSINDSHSWIEDKFDHGHHV